MPRKPPQHKPTCLRRRHRKRGEDDSFYARVRWRRLRSMYLRDHPLCETCRRRGDLTAANEVHHRVPRIERPDLAYDPQNLQALCKSCHSRETLREVQGRLGGLQERENAPLPDELGGEAAGGEGVGFLRENRT